MSDGLIGLGWSLVTKYIIPFVPHAAGALTALLFMRKGMTKLESLFAFSGGFVFAVFVGAGLIEHLGIEGKHTQHALIYLCGLFGLGIARETAKELQELQLLKSLRDKFLGNKSDAS